MITKKEVKKIAKLSRLKLKTKELEELTKDLYVILDYVNKLKELNVEDVPMFFHPLNLKNVMREDKAEKLNIEMVKKVFNLAPEKEKGFFKTRKIL